MDSITAAGTVRAFISSACNPGAPAGRDAHRYVDKLGGGVSGKGTGRGGA